MSNLKIFITGATGYIGEHLALQLVAQGNQVVALVRSEEKAKKLLEAGVECVIGDLGSREVIVAGMEGCDAVFHLAAYARVWPEDDQIFHRINVEGTRTILESASKNKVKKVVFTSTAGVFGPSAEAPVQEVTKRKVPYFNAYEATKAEAEEVARAFAREGLHVTIINPARVYGPGRTTESNAISKLIRLYLKGKWRFIPGDGARVGSYCFIQDVVDGHIKALAHGRSGENYLFGGENLSYNQFFQQLRNTSNQKRKLIRVPVPFLIKASKLMVFWARITNTKPLITPNWVIKYMYDWSVSSQKAIDELGYTVTPFEEGLEKTLVEIEL